MVDKLRRHVALLLLAILGYMVWSDLHPDDGNKSAEAKVERLDIDPKFLVIRPAGDPQLQVADPFHFSVPGPKGSGAKGAAGAGGGGSAGASSGSTGGASAGAPADPHDVAAAWVGTLRVLGHDLLGAFAAHPTAAATAAAAVAAEKAARPPHPFEMVLESTMPLPDGGQARISGHTASVGESLVWLDPDDPPQLAAVEDTTATVTRGTDAWVLDLMGNAHITVGEASAAVAQATETQARSAGMGMGMGMGMGKASSARPPRALPGAGAAPAAAAKAPAASPSGTSHGYRVRSYPGKPK